MKKAQSTLETILVTAGLLAFLVAILPLVMQAYAATSLAADKNHYSSQLEKMALTLNEVEAFGPGNSFALDIVARHTIQIQAKNGLASLSFEFNNTKVTLSKNVSSKAEFKLTLPKGRSELLAENNAEKISVKPKNN